jgi:acyl-coenzyme A synthetase/AMP-(fatty) acid ligase/thioesterase domain-containing protein
LGLTKDEYRAYLPRIGASTLVHEVGNSEAGKSEPAVEVARELKMRLIAIRSSPDDPAGVFCVDNIDGPDEEMPGRQTDAAFLLMTSATTNVPKLVPWSRSNVRAAVVQDSRALELTPEDRFLSLMPLCHASGLYTLLTHLFCGGSVYCPGSFEMASFLEALQVFRPTSFAAGPAIHRTVLEHAQKAPDFFHRIPLRYVRSSGAPFQPAMLAKLEELLGAPVLDGYGLTEMIAATRSTPTMRRPGSVGKAISGEVAILDDSGRMQPPETEGEVVIRGPMLMSGYLDDAEANQAAFTENGWFRTGDIGRLDHQGYLYLVGRRKEMINRGGKKISLPEVDNVLAAHPAVAEAAAFAIPHRTLDEDVAAAVVLRLDAGATELDLRRFAAERLAAYKVPRKIVFVENIPRTTLGKVKRSALAGRFRDLSGTEPSMAAPSASPAFFDARKPTGTQLRIMEIWRRMLGSEQIAVEDNFFELGGDSLTAALMLTQAAESFKIGPNVLPEAEFFDQPSVAALARMVEACAGGTGMELGLPNRLLFLRNAGSRIPLFCFSTTTLDPQRFRHLSRSLGPDQPFVVVCPSPAVQDNRRLEIAEVARQSVVSIRALRKHGPYFLGGYCYGGVVAFEAALQLTAEGEEVALLALFDTPTPGYPKIAREWKSYMRQGAAMLRSLRRGKVPVTTPDLTAHWRTLVRIATERHLAKAQPEVVPVAANSRTDDDWNRLLMREYVPRVLSSPIVHFCASDEPISTQVLNDPRLGWRDFAGASFESHLVAGDHVSILEETNSPALAAKLETVLEAASSMLDQRVEGLR